MKVLDEKVVSDNSKYNLRRYGGDVTAQHPDMFLQKRSCASPLLPLTLFLVSTVLASSLNMDKEVQLM